MHGKRFPEEFRLEALKLITLRGFSVRELSGRLGVSTSSLYPLVKHYAVPPE